VTTVVTDRRLRSATRPTWAEISLANLRDNFQTIRRRIGSAVNICAVVKADAYGHGATHCALALQEEGAQWFGVTSLDEAIPLRDAGIRGPILLMTGFWPGEEEELLRLGLTPTLWTPEQISLLEKAAGTLDTHTQPVHLKIDSGMGRLGASTADLPQVISALKSSPHLFLEGLSTHLASSEVLDSPSVEAQLKAFEQARLVLEKAGFRPQLIHVANSGAIASRPHTWNNLVRPGIALYGYQLPLQRDGQDAAEPTLPLKQVLSWKTRILSLRDMPANQALGYNGTYITRTPSKIAVLPVGYADGLNRQLSSRGRAIVRGKYAPMVGRISMDLTLIDVTGIPGATSGDEVILIGKSGVAEITAREQAAIAGTIPYEILCGISKRVPRKYLNE
jgi:alanine racemase